jgi:hypothetical protein
LQRHTFPSRRFFLTGLVCAAALPATPAIFTAAAAQSDTDDQ